MSDVTLQVFKNELRKRLTDIEWILAPNGKVFTPQQVEIAIDEFTPYLKQLAASSTEGEEKKL